MEIYKENDRATNDKTWRPNLTRKRVSDVPLLWLPPSVVLTPILATGENMCSDFIITETLENPVKT